MVVSEKIWALGQGRTQATKEGGGGRLHPRGSIFSKDVEVEGPVGE